MQIIKIPHERTAVLIGTGGTTKRMVEKRGKVRLRISKEGDVEIRGDSFDEWRAREVVRAVGRGFNPRTAALLFDENFYYKEINLKDLTNKENQIKRQKGRVIGRNGRTREIIEETTEVKLCIYGNTIALIGRIEEIAGAEHALMMLLGGARHSSVYSYLEKRRREMKQAMNILWLNQKIEKKEI